MQPATPRSASRRFGRALVISLVVVAGIIALSCVPLLLLRGWATTKNYAITYRVTASNHPSRPVTISYQEANGQREVQAQTLPWEISWTAQFGTTVGILARSSDPKARLHCEIVIDGISAKESNGNRAGEPAECSITL